MDDKVCVDFFPTQTFEPFHRASFRVHRANVGQTWLANRQPFAKNVLLPPSAFKLQGLCESDHWEARARGVANRGCLLAGDVDRSRLAVGEAAFAQQQAEALARFVVEREGGGGGD